MPEGRISASIKSDTEKLGKLLHTASEDRTVLVRLAKEPLAELAKAGIELDKYYKTPADKLRITADINYFVNGIIGGEIQGLLSGIVEDTSYSRNTSTGMEYNWDASTESTYKFESHTDTTRGTFSDTTRGSVTQQDQGFSGIATQGFGQAMLGPLISAGAIQSITAQFARTVGLSQG
jgi:hypothetical protein